MFMLSEFLQVEMYYDLPETAAFYEEAGKKYGFSALQRAVKDGYLRLKPSMNCEGEASYLPCLTEKGRVVARSQSHVNT